MIGRLGVHVTILWLIYSRVWWLKSPRLPTSYACIWVARDKLIMSSIFSDNWPDCVARVELVMCHLSGLGLSQQLQNWRRLDPLFKLLAVILHCIATPIAVLTPQHTNTGMAKEGKNEKVHAICRFPRVYYIITISSKFRGPFINWIKVKDGQLHLLYFI